MTSLASTLAHRAARLHRPLLIVTAALLVIGVVGLGGLLLDDRELLGLPIWAKTVKFGFSFGLYAATLAWMIGLLTRARRWGWWLGSVVAAGLACDIVLMVVQMIIRGRRLHFNHADETDRMIHNLLATGTYAAFVATAIVALLLSFQRLPDVSQAAAVRAGLLVTLAGLGMGTLMFSPTPEQQAALDTGTRPGVVGSHGVGVPDDGAGLPILGWSTEGGDLRVAHFAGLHALQLLPLLAVALLLLSRRYAGLRSPYVRRDLVRVAASAQLALVALLTWQALRGQSVIHPDLWTLLTAGAIAGSAATGCVLALRRRRAATEPEPVTVTTSGNI
ncbi:hypothetical protein CFN78_19505 [Amycolatopsis antarctica]|uniref:Uncharacterized protein n=1 Tax=Amycolatopsis antarctica TaxID=1854586 RepID=A0A263D2W3_9PSEU|nr:hypothetical protein [Amycolatopsis antarctica]OZM71695.1 hypothetical protein CFN78_19505 [Amycolatopsis antarctica]